MDILFSSNRLNSCYLYTDSAICSDGRRREHTKTLILYVQNVSMHCVENVFLSGSFEDRAIFHVIQLSYDGGGLMCPLQIDR